MKIISLSLPLDLATGAVESINFSLDKDGETVAETIVADQHNFKKSLELVDAFKAGDLSNEELASSLYEQAHLAEVVHSKITQVGGILEGRMTIEGDHVFIDGDPIDHTLESYILRLLREDGSPKDYTHWRGFSRFVEKLYSNQSEFVRKQFFGWLQHETLFGEGFTLTPDGDVIGYKGCRGTIEAPTSINTGTAVVNGVRYKGAIPNPLGAVVEMPRSQVQDDPSIGCSTGLHVGTYAYASSFSRGVLLKVKFSPAAVVSVPTECESQKVRVFRYTVLEVIEGPDNTPTYVSSSRSDVTDVSDELVEALDNALEACPATIEFTYKGRPRSVVPGDFYEDFGWKLDAEEDGQFKTFFIGRMSDISVDGEPLMPQEEAAEEAESEAIAEATAAPAGDSVASTVATGLTPEAVITAAMDNEQVVKFSYNGKSREVTPLEWEASYNGKLLLALDAEGNYKSYRLSKISQLEVVASVDDEVEAVRVFFSE